MFRGGGGDTSNGSSNYLLSDTHLPLDNDYVPMIIMHSLWQFYMEKIDSKIPP